MAKGWSMRFDRRISTELLDALRPTGWLHGLVRRRNANPMMLDLQARRDQAGRRSWVSLYAGLSSVLDVDERHGQFRLRSHPTYQKIGVFDGAWSSWQPESSLADQWSKVDQYLDAVLADMEVLSRHLRREGRVHSLLCAGMASGYRVVQREAVIAFSDDAARRAALGSLAARIYGAVEGTRRTDPWWPGVRDRGKWPPLGPEVDLLGVDDFGRLLIIEAKPAEEIKGITWAPAQVSVYAELFASLLQADSEAGSVLGEMLAQRVELGLTPLGEPLRHPLRLVPIVAIGPGPISPSALGRLDAVCDAVAGAFPRPVVDPLEVWVLGEQGGIDFRWRPGIDPLPGESIPAAENAATFTSAARKAAVEWRDRTQALPASALDPAPYRGRGPALPFCLPVSHSKLNLLPEAREAALTRFADAGIPWHAGLAAGPSNHLLSSQVQCANCLAPLVSRPDALARLFGSVLPIAEVVPFGAPTSSRYDLTDHVVFEWIGLADHLGERNGGAGTRGANTTSADAAIRYRSTHGRIEIALIEWKYTEQYRGHELSGGSAGADLRRARYHAFWGDPDSPIRTDLIPYADLFVESFYQLLRLQLLAWRMERARELDADVVRLVYVAPATNVELAASFNRLTQRSLGRVGGSELAATVWDAWASMQRRPDRFAFMDSAALVDDSSPCSDEFKSRYGHLSGVGSRRPARQAAEQSAHRLRSAISMAVLMLRRVSDDGGVLSQVASMTDEDFWSLDPHLIEELASRLEEIAELTRRARAEEVFELLSRARSEA